MRIGIATPADIRNFLPYFEDEEAKKIIRENTNNQMASAVHSIVHSFIKKGHHVSLFVLANKYFTVKGDGLNIYGIKRVRNYPVKYLWGNFINANRISQVIKKYIAEIDVLHAQWTYEFAYGSKGLASILPVFCTIRDWCPYIWKLRNVKDKVPWSFNCIMNNRVLRNRNIHLIANSPYTASLVKKNYQQELPIISNPINSAFLRNETRIVPKGLHILCISSANDKVKNIEVLLHAFSLLQSKYSVAQLSLVGPPFKDDMPAVEVWRNSGLLRRVHLLGRKKHDELKEIIDKATVFVCPSLEESFGNILLESMARKVPVIGGGQSGAVPYVLHQGKAGYLCDVSDAKNLASTIEYVYHNYEEATQRAEWAFEMLKREYLETGIADKHVELYQSFM